MWKWKTVCHAAGSHAVEQVDAVAVEPSRIVSASRFAAAAAWARSSSGAS